MAKTEFELEQERLEKEGQANGYRQLLTASQTSAIEASDGFISRVDYAAIRAQRQEWRRKLRELELDLSLDEIRRDKLAEIAIAAQQIIHKGVEVDGKNYSLTEHDQIELMAQLAAVQAGAEGVPYHADGELCRIFSAAEFMAVADAAIAHIFFHRTYCNHLNTWIRRSTKKEEITKIIYGADLPKDLATSLAALIATMGG